MQKINLKGDNQNIYTTKRIINHNKNIKIKKMTKTKHPTICVVNHTEKINSKSVP